MPLLVDENGVTIQDQAEIVAELSATWKLPANLGPSADTSTASKIGKFTRVHAEREAVVQQALSTIVSYLWPSLAPGYHLDTLAQLGGVTRNPATYAESGLGEATTTGACTITAGSIVRNTRTLQDWVVVTDVIASGVGVFSVTIRGRSVGVQRFEAADTWVIVTPIANWASFATSADSPTQDEGSAIETDSELRVKRKNALLSAGNDFDAILAAVSLVPGVGYVGGLNNRSQAVQAGVPVGAIEVVVDGGDDTAIADAIFAHLPPGTEAFGDVIAARTLANGDPINIGFTRPTEIPAYILITVATAGAEYPYVANIVSVLSAAVLATAEETMGDPGADIIPGALTRDLWDLSADSQTGRPTLTSIVCAASIDDITYVGTPITFNHKQKATWSLARIAVDGILGA